MKQVLFSDEEYADILTKLDEFMRQAEHISEVDHKVLVYNILQHFDCIHREPISRIISALEAYPKLKEELTQDKTVQKLCELYDISVSDINKEVENPLLHIPQNKTWLTLGKFDDLENKKVYPGNYKKTNFLVVRIDKELFAVKNQCHGSILPIDKGVLEDHFLICPLHGCKYDLKTGKATNNADKYIETYLTEVEKDNSVKVQITHL